jgi:excinuclease ABC subunit C
MIASTLEAVEGLGPARRERLMVQFGSLDALRHTTLDELEALAWLPNEVARSIYDHLRAPSEPRPTKGGARDE